MIIFDIIEPIVFWHDKGLAGTVVSVSVVVGGKDQKDLTLYLRIDITMNT